MKDKVIKKRIGTKIKILKAATTLFSELGYKGTSIRNIAREVNIRESAIYNHYKNKEELFLDVTKNILPSPLTQENKIKDLAIEGKSYLIAYTQHYKELTIDKNNENMFRLLMIELFQNKNLREQFMHDFHDESIKKISEGFFIMMQNNLIPFGDPMLLSFEFLSTLFYIRLQTTILNFDNKSIDYQLSLFDKHVDYFWDSIKKDN